MKRFARILVGVALVAAGIAISALLWITRPEAKEAQGDKEITSVVVVPARFEPKSFTIPSQGLIEASRRSQLAAEVGGKVLETSSQFEVGLAVNAGDMLLQLDPTDYEAALEQAKSSLADAESAAASERARAAQAVRDWKKLGNTEEPPDLVARGPQLRSAVARVKSAEAAVRKAKKDLERTTIRAPYPAIIAATMAEKGSFLPPGTPVAEVFESGPFEVRLPLSLDESQFLRVGKDGNHTGTLTVESEIAGVPETWKGSIIRTEGEIDRSTRSLYVVARMNPVSESGNAKLQPGQFVRASLPGREIPGIATVPFSAFLDLDHVSIVDEENVLNSRKVNVIFREGDTVFVSRQGSDLVDGDLLCLTDMIQGIKVSPSPLEEDADLEEGDLSKTQPVIKP